MTYHYDYSQGEALVLQNPEYQIRANLEFAPRSLQPREGVQNAFEAFLSDEEHAAGKRTIVIRARHFGDYKSPKFSIINTGNGLTFEQMATLSNINATGKELGIVTGNRGEGIKVSSCMNNPLGIWWFTRKDGAYYRTAIGLDPVSGTFKRLRAFVEGLGWQGAEPFEPNEEELRHFPAEAAGDFVEVVFLGKSSDHNTFAHFMEAGYSNADFLWNHLQMRYYDKSRLERVPVEVEIFYQPNPNAEDMMSGAPMLFANEVVPPGKSRDYDEATVTIDGGVKIRYILARNETAARRLGTGGHLALVYQSEKYDISTGMDWTRLAPSYGITQVQNLLCVYVILPDDYECHGDRYREKLVDAKTKAEIPCDQFRLDIAQNVPKWLAEAMSVQQRTSNADTVSKLKKYISQLPFMRKLALNDGNYTPGRGSPGSSSRKTTQNKTQNQNQNSQNNNQIKGTISPAGKSRAEIQAPKIIWLLESELSDPQNHALVGRIAEFRPGPDGGTLVINEFSPTFKMLVEMFWRYAEMPDTLRSVTIPYIRTLLHNKVEFRLAQDILHIQCQSGSRHWTDAQIRSRMTPDAIENFALPIFHELTGLKRNLMNAPGIKAAVAQNSLSGSGAPGVVNLVAPATMVDADEDSEIFQFSDE